MRRNTLARLEEMLEQAINGTFREEDYNETRLSRLEAKWKRYLAGSQSSRQRTLQEQRQIKQLISDISHQTKTPIANILLYSQLLQEKVTDPELTIIVDNIRSQSEKLDFLIRSLVKSSRLESELLVLHPKRQLVAPLLFAVVEAAREEADQKKLTIKVSATNEYACFDRKWTEEALGNLLDNAIKYSHQGGNIEISVTEYEMFVSVNVKDYGIGIREEEQAQIFERFYRSREAEGERGVGIGLYLVREIAVRQSGYVKVKSEHGKGSIFSFYMSKEIV